MKSKTLRRVRLAIERFNNEHAIKAMWWRDQAAWWRNFERRGKWTDEACSRIEEQCASAARYYETGAVGPFPNLNLQEP